ncbi:MAG: hypothetical protein Q4F65_13860 [Propionibacteriaceae bacterium]|nr:hypothetical protein [Propionibacteriaceae bacterium]
MNTNTAPALPPASADLGVLSRAHAFDLDAVFSLCAEYLNDQAADGVTVTAADAVESFEDAHGLALADAERAAVTRQLADVVRAIDAFGPVFGDSIRLQLREPGALPDDVHIASASDCDHRATACPECLPEWLIDHRRA